MESIRANRNRYIPALLWLLLVTILLCLPGDEFPKETWMTRIRFDKWVHFLLFLVLVITWCRSFRDKETGKRKIFLIIGAACVLYGIVMEFVQEKYVVFRGFETGDILADFLGAATGYLISVRRYIKK